MSTIEIIVLCVIASILILISFLYIYHSIKMKPKVEKKENKEENKKETVVEQKPIPVGIIREEKKEELTTEFDMAPFKEKQETNSVSEKEKIKSEVNSLSSEMKKVIMSDLLKPKF